MRASFALLALLSRVAADWVQDPENYCSEDSSKHDIGRKLHFAGLAYESSDGPRVLVEGGEITWNKTDGETVILPSNNSYIVPLDHAWTPRDVKVKCLDKGDSPTWLHAKLWPNPEKEGSVLMYYGKLSPKFPQFSALDKAKEVDELMPESREVWELDGDKWSSHSISSIDPGYLAGEAWSGTTAYFLGGVANSMTSRELYQSGSEENMGLATFDGQWSYDPPATEMPSSGVLRNPFLHHVRLGDDDDEFLVAFGGLTGVDATNDGLSFRNLDEISVYNVKKQEWSSQRATGDVPLRRKLGCSVAVAGDNGTWEIYIYGGSPTSVFVASYEEPDNAHILSQVSVLSLPSFRWHTVENSQTTSRAMHVCVLGGKSQMISIGGGTPDLKTTKQLADEWPQGLGVFDLNKLEWTHEFDPDNGEYKTPDAVKEVLEKGRYPDSWDNPELGEWLVTKNEEEGDGGNEVGDGNGEGSNGDAEESEQGSSKDGNDSSSGPNTGAIVGGVVGGVAALALLAIAAFCFLRRSKARRERPTGWTYDRPNEYDHESMGVTHVHHPPTNGYAVNPAYLSTKSTKSTPSPFVETDGRPLVESDGRELVESDGREVPLEVSGVPKAFEMPG